ncbi:hypothetical protein LPJ66_000380 [Kickxella alabastrina]|uniref:Uncharacterized protein n=1 Tax=Kickxella alabastrina TaxID=61397 RepID=A0ACC1IW96_9FUNG|nr:hypothetical protein LPJ66_000380 [Kickxella alabastrina]
MRDELAAQQQQQEQVAATEASSESAKAESTARLKFKPKPKRLNMKQTLNFHTFKQRKDSFMRRGRYRWPYLKYTSYLAQPDTLALAGFSFNPVKDAPDNVQCFHCGFELTGWEPSDDPFSEHYAHQPSCTYATLHCQTREAHLGNKVEWKGWPVNNMDAETKKKLVDMRSDVATRLATFNENEWPHTGRKDWNVTPEKLANAGFYYTPEWPGDDTAACLFCGYMLAEWEAEDDPNAEHEKRVPECLFFTLLRDNGMPLVASPLPKDTPRRVSMRTSLQAVTIVDSDDDERAASDSSASKRPRLSGDLIKEVKAEEQDDDVAGLMAEAKKEQLVEESDQEEHDEMRVDQNDEQSEMAQNDEESGVVQNDEESEIDHDEWPANKTDAHDAEEQEDHAIEEGYEHEPHGIGEEHQMDAQSGPDTQVGPDISDASEISDYSGNEQEQSDSDIEHASDTSPDTQLSNTQVANDMLSSPEEMAIDEYQQSTQVGDAEDAAWDLDEVEEDMTVEEFIHACCNQKVASLEASAAQMISSFMQRAENTRERIYNMPL